MGNELLKMGLILKKKRYEKGYSTRELGDIVGVSNATISRIENGLVGNTGLMNFLRICHVLDINAPKLLDECNLLADEINKKFYVVLKINPINNTVKIVYVDEDIITDV